jgi:hypothetical protein
MRKTLAIAALMLAFCCPALAGEIPNPPAPEQPPALTDGIMHGDNTSTLTQIVLTVLISVLP